MLWILQFLLKNRTIVSLALAILLSIAMIGSPEKQQQRIARTLTLTIFYPFQYTVDQVTRVKDIFRENRHLKETVTTLSTRLALLEEQASENSRLLEMLIFKERYSFDLVPARVVASEPSHFIRGCVINVGKDKGILPSMPVVNHRGVVGRIAQVSGGISLVQLISDPLSRTSVMTRDSRDVGIFETENGKSFYVRYRSHAQVKEGDTLITSGLGGVFPKGLDVGTVTKCVQDLDPLFKKAWIKPFADIAAVEDVFVIRFEPRWQAFRDELDSLTTSQESATK